MIRISTRFRAFLLFPFLMLMAWLYPIRSESEAPVFRVERIGQMISNSENCFLVYAPEPGEFTVTIYDSYHTYRIIRKNIQEGENRVLWDGCAYNQERLDTHHYSFDFLLTGKSGQTYTFSFVSPVVDNAQKLQFALPSGKYASLSDGSDWFLEAKSVFNGTLVLEFIPDGMQEPSAVYYKSLHQGRVEHLTFSQIVGNHPPEAGLYTVCAYEQSKPDDIASFMMEITEDSIDSPAVKPTGEIMPSRESDDAQIWEAMIQPSVVVDIDYLSHQAVYMEKDLKSAVLGTLHGQTQCVSVLKTEGEWAKIGAWNHEEAAYIEGWVPYNHLKTVQSNQDYGLLVDKQKQTLIVFYQGRRIEELLVSTGRMEKNKFENETSAGCFVTGLHRVDFSTMGNRYDFVIQYDGGNLLHQIPYTSNGNKDFTMGRAFLGAKASHACIRIQDEPGPMSGINAYWIWTHIPYHTKLIILDDPEECEKEKALLSGTSSNRFPVIPDLSGISPGMQTVTISFGGDVVPGCPEEYLNHPNGFDAIFDQFGADYPFSGIQSILTADDLSCVSLGCVLQENNSQEDFSLPQRIRGLPEYAEIFPEGSVELVAFSNEHSLDFREDGFLNTLSALRSRRTSYVSSSRPGSIRINGCLFGFGACTESEYLTNPHIISEDVRQLKDQDCQYIIYLCHWGNRKEEHHGKLQEAMARACEREGVDLVIGVHPSDIQGIDLINQMPVLYGIGTLIPCITDIAVKREALIVQASFNLTKKEIPRLSLVPVTVSSGEEQNYFRPVVAGGTDKEKILMKVKTDSAVRFPGWTE